MVHHNIGHHHKHKRKRIYQKLEEYPHPDPWKRFLDKAVYVAGIFGVVMTIPQVWTIWVVQEAAGINIISWTSYLLIGIVWLFYGIAHKEKPIIVINTCWFFLYILIISGALIYG